MLKHYLASKLSHFQQLAERLEETLCNTEKELRWGRWSNWGILVVVMRVVIVRRVTTERQSQADEINLMKVSGRVFLREVSFLLTCG